MLKIGSRIISLCIAIEPESKRIPALSISEGYMFVAERFIGGDLVKINGKHPVYTVGGDIWYLMTCRILELEHHNHSS